MSPLRHPHRRCSVASAVPFSVIPRFGHHTHIRREQDCDDCDLTLGGVEVTVPVLTRTTASSGRFEVALKLALQGARTPFALTFAARRIFLDFGEVNPPTILGVGFTFIP